MGSTGAEPPAVGGQWFPPHWPDRIRALVRGDLTAPAPRAAATVLLLRDPDEEAAGLRGGDAADREPEGAGRGGPEVFLLRRRTSMAFAGGAYAYPGGGVDSRDRTPVSWAGPGPEGWAQRLGIAPDEAQAVVCAAIRETFEECGVLLAGPDPTAVVPDTTGARWEADRRALVAREQSFAAFLARRALVVRDDLLGGWARWITPEIEERRYDTWFFVAVLPAGQRSRNASGEADRAEWTRPAEALAGYERGELLMMPPTVATLRSLLPQPTATAALAAAGRQDLAPVQAVAGLQGAEIVVSWPGHPEFELRVPAATPATPGTHTSPANAAGTAAATDSGEHTP